MLSDDLKSLERYMEQVRDRAVILTEEGLAAFYQNLKACRRQAQAMERRSLIAQQLTADNLTEDVILFPVQARPIRRLISSYDPDQGGAA